MLMWFNPSHADKLLDGSGHTAAELVALATDRKPLPRFPLPVSTRATVRTQTRILESSNVVAKLEGSDPKLKTEHLAWSAHIDHLGIGESIR